MFHSVCLCVIWVIPLAACTDNSQEAEPNSDGLVSTYPNSYSVKTIELLMDRCMREGSVVGCTCWVNSVQETYAEDEVTSAEATAALQGHRSEVAERCGLAAGEGEAKAGTSRAIEDSGASPLGMTELGSKAIADPGDLRQPLSREQTCVEDRLAQVQITSGQQSIPIETFDLIQKECGF